MNMVFKNWLSSLFTTAPDNDPGLQIVRRLIYLILFSILLTALYHPSSSSFGTFLGGSFLIFLSCTLLGSLLGFLFGIPRSRQKTDDALGSSVESNTNLEQISDWLTKIIVGVGLIEAQVIKLQFDGCISFFAKGLGDAHEFNLIFSECIAMSGLILGFLYTYLWSRVKLYKLLNEINIDKLLENSLNNPNNPINKAINDVQLKRINARIYTMEHESIHSSAIENAKPKPITEVTDIQKNRWGSNTKANGREIYVKSHKANEAKTIFQLTIAIRNVDGSAFDQEVLFMLHDTFNPCIKAGINVNGEMCIDLSIYEAFTLGAILLADNTTLELDLNQVEGLPKEMKY